MPTCCLSVRNLLKLRGLWVHFFVWLFFGFVCGLFGWLVLVVLVLGFFVVVVGFGWVFFLDSENMYFFRLHATEL